MTEKSQTDYAALLKRSLVAIDELEARLAAAQRASTEPIAIVGMACRFPGGANSPEAFWELLKNGVDAVTEVPKERWDADEYFDPDPDAVGKSYTRWGSFLDGVDLFDADLFGISPREAVSLDPQQRILLEVTWEALERSGIAPSSVMGTATAAYIGITTHDYANYIIEALGMNNGGAYAASGTAHSMASGRIAYAFGLTGPNAAIDTACSSSLVALHWAVQSLRAREANIVLAGGVNLTLMPAGSILTSRARMMSFTGRCKTFDASADGYVRGEGCGMLVLKRLADAQRDGDQVLAVIRGSALNQDGRSSGLTAPNGRAQEAVVRAALGNAGLRPDDISYIEAHGTGTSLGDPIEVKALGEVFGARSRQHPLMLGSVKTNIGHTEATAGVAGVIKTVLALQHRTIPPHLHLVQPNPLIPWDRLPVQVPVALTPWESPQGAPRRAGVSSFGFSGTNGHVILEEAPAPVQPPTSAVADAQLLVLSAQTPQALSQLAERFIAYLDKDSATPLADIAHSLARGRSHLGERLAIVARDHAEARERLAAFVAGDEAGAARGRASGGTVPEVVFLFTGQGAQYAGMAHRLYETQPVFRAAMDECARLVDPYLDRPLLEVIAGAGDAAGLIDDTAYTQPALFAVEYSLAQLWRSWGVEPTAVMGHSVGEYVAACLAGVFSLADGLKLIAARARLMSALPRDGAMVAVFTDEATVREALAGHEREVAIAACNGPTSIVISGRTEAVEAVLARLAARAVEFQRLSVSHAFHSPLMEPMLDAFERIAATVAFAPPQIGLMSNLTGKQAGVEVTRPSYWREHVREAVRFGDSVGALLQDGYRLFLEIGPTPTLVGMARRCAGADAATWVSSLRKGRDDTVSMLEALGQLHVCGQPIRWSSVFGGSARLARAIDLPTYPFQRQRYWQERSESPDRARLAPLRIGHPLLGGAIDSPLHIFQSEIGLASHPWLADHRILDYTPFPATGFLELALAGVREVCGSLEGELRGVVIREGLMLPEEGSAIVQIIVSPAGEHEFAVQVCSRPPDAVGGAREAAWRQHMSATYVAAPGAGPAVDAPEVVRDGPAFAVADYYATLEGRGATYGPAFRCIRDIVATRDGVLGRLQVSDALADEAAAQLLHPALLDAAFQLIGVLLPDGRDGRVRTHTYMPVEVERYRVLRQGARTVRCHARVEPFVEGAESIRGELQLFDESGALVAEVVGLGFRRVTRAVLERAMHGSRAASGRDDWFFEPAWRARSRSPETPAQSDGRWVILADDTGVATQLAAQLRAQGAGVALMHQRRASDAPTAGERVDPTDAAGLRRALESCARADSRPLVGVISLWALDAATHPVGISDIEAGQRALLSGALSLVHALADVPARLWIVTRGAQPVAGSVPDLLQAPLVGLGNVIATEVPELRCVRIDLDPVCRPDEVQLLFDAIWHADEEDRLALREGIRYVARLSPGTLTPAEQCRVLTITERGQLDRLELKPLVRRPPKAGEIELRVRATGLNFRDVLNALGLYPGDPGPLGNECSGIVTAVGEGVEHLRVGDEAVAMVDRSFASHVIAPAALTVRKPPPLSHVEAATVPVAFLTAAYALHSLGRIRKGDRVLIHAATGGVGMAAVQIARLAGAEIIGTAGSPAKRELARSLGVHHVADSRSLGFEQEVLRATGGQGVDIVLNSLAGDFIPASLRLLRAGGRFIEIGKTAIWNATEVARQFPQVEYHALYLGEVAAAQPDYLRGMLEELLQQLVSGELQALPQRIYPIERAQEAFRFMAQGHHIGKIVLTQPQPLEVSPEATYLITGGLGGLGLACARWLVDLGARHLVLLSRRPPTEAQQGEIDRLADRGVEVLAAQADIAEHAQVQEVLGRVRTRMPPLRGVLHAAGFLDDGMLSEQSWPRFERVMSPKVRGSWNLHASTGSDPLDFFVMFSSGAALLGSPGQGNYAAANAFLDALAYVRRAAGLPALSINWGSWSEVGMAAGVDEQHQRRWAALGLRMIEPEAGVQMLQSLLQSSVAPQVAALPINRSKLPANSGSFLSELVVSARPTAGAAAATARPDILPKLRELAGAERIRALGDFLAEQVIRVFALGSSYRIDPHRSLMDMGMDSLMAMELRNRLQAALKVPVAAAELLAGPTAQELTALLASRLEGEAAEGTAQQERAVMQASAAGTSDAAATSGSEWEEGTL